MDGVTELDRLAFTVVLLGIGFLALFLVAEVIERAYEREERRKRRIAPKIERRERQLLGDDWRDRV
jgi:hypothetical protein